MSKLPYHYKNDSYDFTDVLIQELRKQETEINLLKDRVRVLETQDRLRPEEVNEILTKISLLWKEMVERRQK